MPKNDFDDAGADTAPSGVITKHPDITARFRRGNTSEVEVNGVPYACTRKGNIVTVNHVTYGTLKFQVGTLNSLTVVWD